MAAIIFPTPAQALLQTPLNTFSTTSTPLANTSNSFTYVYNTTLGVWEGSAGGSSVVAATLAEAAAGTINTKFSSPQTAVPKDASGMTGAALIPTGTTLQQPATPVGGMLRMNTTLNPDSLEVYDGTATAWRQLAYVSQPTSLGNLTPANGSTLPSSGVYDNITISAGVTVNAGGVVFLKALNSITIDGTINGVGLGPQGGYVNATQTLNAGSGTMNVTAGTGIGLGSGSAGSTLSPSTVSFVSLSSSSGAPGGITAYYSVTGTSEGGSGGGGIVLICDGPITVGASALIDMSGGNAPPAVSTGGPVGASGGGGGGSGGLILLQSSQSISLAVGSALTTKGGNGANSASLGFFSGGGGGGGGGGYIVLNSPNTTDSSTKTLTGGTAGAGTNVNAFGAPGASFGGSGGGAGGAGLSSSNGTAGVVLLNTVNL